MPTLPSVVREVLIRTIFIIYFKNGLLDVLDLLAECSYNILQEVQGSLKGREYTCKGDNSFKNVLICLENRGLHKEEGSAPDQEEQVLS